MILVGKLLWYPILGKVLGMISLCSCAIWLLSNDVTLNEYVIHGCKFCCILFNLRAVVSGMSLWLGHIFLFYSISTWILLFHPMLLFLSPPVSWCLCLLQLVLVVLCIFPGLLNSLCSQVVWFVPLCRALLFLKCPISLGNTSFLKT